MALGVGLKRRGISASSCPTDLIIIVHIKAAATATDPITISAKTAGTITTVNDGGLTNLIVELNSVPVTAPFILAIGDILEMSFDAATGGEEIKLIGTY